MMARLIIIILDLSSFLFTAITLILFILKAYLPIFVFAFHQITVAMN
jgi:hypothetical protein